MCERFAFIYRCKWHICSIESMCYCRNRNWQRAYTSFHFIYDSEACLSECFCEKKIYSSPGSNEFQRNGLMSHTTFVSGYELDKGAQTNTHTWNVCVSQMLTWLKTHSHTFRTHTKNAITTYN